MRDVLETFRNADARHLSDGLLSPHILRPSECLACFGNEIYVYHDGTAYCCICEDCGKEWTEETRLTDYVPPNKGTRDKWGRG